MKRYLLILSLIYLATANYSLFGNEFKVMDDPVDPQCDVTGTHVSCGEGVTQQQCANRQCCWDVLKNQCYYKKNDNQCTNVLAKVDCGHVGTTEDSCIQSGCCWQALGEQDPWCFQRSSDMCSNINYNATTGTNFDPLLIQLMRTQFLDNINVFDIGATVAAPDQGNPDGPNRFDWMRIGGLSYYVYMQLYDSKYADIQEYMNKYQSWVKKAQSVVVLNGTDVRVEPKFNIPDATPFNGTECRPQTDGPGLRSFTLSNWAKVLVDNNKTDQAKNDVWPLIKNDLDWIVPNWNSSGCDLWEEVESDNFLWNRMIYVSTLNEAAALADLLKIQTQTNYSDLATSIYHTLEGHFNGDYIQQSENRKVDGAVIHAIATFGTQNMYGPATASVAKTIKYYTEIFCLQYPINRIDTTLNVFGVLIGRYPGDKLDGGNPWQLLTASLAQVFYRAASTVKQGLLENEEYVLPEEDFSEWKKTLNLNQDATLQEFIASATSAGDSVMQRIQYHVKNDAGVINEQIDKQTGQQTSTENLTWSYVNILRALQLRDNLQ